MLVLRIKPKSSTRTASVLNHRAIFSTHELANLKWQFFHFDHESTSANHMECYNLFSSWHWAIFDSLCCESVLTSLVWSHFVFLSGSIWDLKLIVLCMRRISLCASYIIKGLGEWSMPSCESCYERWTPLSNSKWSANIGHGVTLICPVCQSTNCHQ